MICVQKKFCQSLSDSKTKTVDTSKFPPVIFEQLHEVLITDEGKIGSGGGWKEV
jgi:hypothetical protein